MFVCRQQKVFLAYSLCAPSVCVRALSKNSRFAKIAALVCVCALRNCFMRFMLKLFQLDGSKQNRGVDYFEWVLQKVLSLLFCTEKALETNLATFASL